MFTPCFKLVIASTNNVEEILVLPFTLKLYVLLIAPIPTLSLASIKTPPEVELALDKNKLPSAAIPK